MAVGNGDGIKDILLQLGVDKVIDGGQSMNPSTNDFVQAITEINAREIIIFPNNKNIISAAKQAASLSEKIVEVIPTKTIPEAISCMVINDDQQSIKELISTMEEETKNVKTLEITKAVKNSKINNLAIEKGDIIGLIDGSLEVKGDNYEKVIIELFDKVWDEEELITIYYGENIDEATVDQIKEGLMNKFNIPEIEVYHGGQPLYPYIISLE